MNGKHLIFGVIFVCACSGDVETVERQTTSALTQSATNEPQQEIETREKAKIASPAGPYLEAVEETELAKFPTGDLSVFPESEKEKMSQIDVPILAPKETSLLNDLLLTHKQHWYAISTRNDGVTFYIKGTRLAFDVTLDIPHPPKEDIIISRSHGIVTASFRRFNVSYNMDIECTSPESDPRCADDDTVRGIVNELVLYGGVQ